MQPRVTVVVDNYNYARFLPRAIESALAQTRPGTEVVVVDDGSTDGSVEVIRRYGARVIPVLQERNRGQAAALNEGFRRASGDLVIFLDADDYLYPHAAARVAEAWAPGVAKVQYRLDLVDAGGERIDLYPAPEVRFDSGDVVPLLLSYGRYETSVTSGNAFARSVLEKILPIPEAEFAISADGYLVTVAPFHGAVVSIDEALGAYRQHGSNAWAEVGEARLGELLRRSLEHDARKYQVLRSTALGQGKVAAPDLGMGDHQHLTSRLASMCVAPSQHPYGGDRRAALGVRGALASRSARLPPSRRALLAAWFLAAGGLPRPLAERLVAWRLVPQSRPRGLDRLAKVVRRALR